MEINSVEDQKKYFLNVIKSSLSKPLHITSTDDQYSVPKKKTRSCQKACSKEETGECQNIQKTLTLWNCISEKN